MAKTSKAIKTKKTNNQKETMDAIRTMVDFIKDETDRAVVTLAAESKIDANNVQSVSNLIKLTIESAFIKTSGIVQKTVK